MDSTILYLIVGLVVGLLVGGGIGYFLFNKALTSKRDAMIKEVEEKEEIIKQKRILQAKEKFNDLKAKHDDQVKEKNRKLQSAEDRIKGKEGTLNKQIESNKRKEKDLDNKIKNIDKQQEILTKKQNDLEDARIKAVKILEETSGISADDAKKQLMEQLNADARQMAARDMQDILDDAKLKANQEAKKIVIQSIQRIATEEAIENSVSVFNIESDEIKGRIIGREGRNIRAIEAATGVEVVVDDTPEAIILSCFDPVRREIARLSLHQLVTDGRIHPARIEESI